MSPQRLKPQSRQSVVNAAVNRCATQNQAQTQLVNRCARIKVKIEFFRQLV
jgi:hypothetical protein